MGGGETFGELCIRKHSKYLLTLTYNPFIFFSVGTQSVLHCLGRSYPRGLMAEE